jgi:hypothetical protein
MRTTETDLRIAKAVYLGWTKICCGDSEFPNFIIGLPPGKKEIIDFVQIPELDKEEKEYLARQVTT